MTLTCDIRDCGLLASKFYRSSHVEWIADVFVALCARHRHQWTQGEFGRVSFTITGATLESLEISAEEFVLGNVLGT